MIKLIFQKKLMLIKQMNRKNVSFAIIGKTLNKNFSYGQYTCVGCYDIGQNSMHFKNMAIAHIKKSAYRIYFQHMNKHKAKKLIKKFDPIDKTGSINCND